MTIDARDPDVLIDAAIKTMDAVERLNQLAQNEGAIVTSAVTLMLQAVTAEATLALALYAQRDHRQRGDDRK